MEKYKLHILFIRAIILAIPIGLFNLFDYITIKLDYFTSWLSNILPDPRK